MPTDLLTLTCAAFLSSSMMVIRFYCVLHWRAMLQLDELCERSDE